MKQTGMLGLVLLSAFLFSCSVRGDLRVIKLGHGLDATHSVHQGMEFMARRAAELSNGGLRIDIYPSQQLGTERESLELLQIGSLGMTKVSASVLEGFAPAFRVYSLPFLFQDDDHRWRVLKSQVGRKLLLSTEKYWLRGLAYYDSGTRSFYTKNRPVLTPNDLIGLKIRVQESPTAVRLVQALGGSPTPISWGELYTALQQGVVDGAENNPPSFHLSRHYEVCRYYVLNEHTAVPDVLLISTAVWNSLTPHQRQILQQAAEESTDYQRKLWQESTRASLEAVEKDGVEIVYPDKEPFVEKVQPLIEEYSRDPEIRALIEQIRAMEEVRETMEAGH